MDEDLKLSNADYRLLSIVWEFEPVASPELCRLAEVRLGWKRTTTYTVLKRLCDKGALQNENTIVTSKMGRECVQAIESRNVVARVFDGSLPKFIAAFLGDEKISDSEAEQIRRIIDEYRGRK
ncbi:transcriptional repressor, copy family [Heliomicrobium modesticaldum Ice1]|uniref:Transcriptional repressor, copy family n=1 Tax=Heliobacterium modesticaldum (strain ATCC 51547 / Ice1) TaxID=498761 RepID=B0TCW6_HELMI|nr:BlaI/MecI/CopY family transcriptional regulator [Heliomicrobium modesticaldum]ABZ85417.1 transcriptional repressor, copy family [Heliomicrobium modesticaldum Ice1]